MPTFSNAQLATVRAVVAGVAAYLLSQPDVAVPPLLKVVLGAVVVACAILGNAATPASVTAPAGSTITATVEPPPAPPAP